MIKQKCQKRGFCAAVLSLVIFGGTYLIADFNKIICDKFITTVRHFRPIETTATTKIVEKRSTSLRTNRTTVALENEKKKILLVTYMRSGSTFTSEILKQGGRVFFIFEPFWGVYGRAYRTEDKVCGRNGKCRDPKGYEEQLARTTTALDNIYKCNFHDLPAEILASFWMFPESSGYTKLKSCYNPKSLVSDLKTGRFRHDVLKRPKCIPRLEHLCKTSELILVKTIRLSLQLFPRILAKIPNLKAVHLLRDPRAILHSRAAIGDVSLNMIEEHARGLCDRMNEDLDISHGSISNIKFECVTQNPIKTVQKLFDNLNLTYSGNLNNWLKRHTQGNSTSFSNKFGVKHANSSAIASKWREKVHPKILSYINEQCGMVYKTLGLPTVTEDTTLVYQSMCKE